MRSLKDIIISALVPIKKNSLWIKVNEDRGARVFSPQPSGWKEIFFRVSKADVKEEVEEIVDETFIRRPEFEQRLSEKADKTDVVFEKGTGANSVQQKGTGATASGILSIAEGGDNLQGGEPGDGEELLYSKAEGYASHAEGAANAIGRYSHAEGGGNSIEEGHPTRSTAEGKYSHAEGSHTYAKGGMTHAEGNLTIAEGYGSHAEGSNTLTTGNTAHAEGINTVAGVGDRPSVSTNTDAGNYAHAEGNGTQASGNSAHSEGKHTLAEGSYSHAEGINTRASGQNSHVEGHSQNNVLDTTVVKSNDGIIEDWNLNKFTLAKGAASHAEGKDNLALGGRAHAEGYQTIASGANSHSENYNNTASGSNSHAEGASCEAKGERSHVEGFHTETNNASEHAEGSYNKSNTDTRHSIGIGTSNDTRKNAFEIMKNGDAYLYGLGDYEGNNLKTDETKPSKTVQEVIKSLENDSVWEKGSGENSVQQKGTGARAIGAESVAEGHGEIQRSQGVITRDGSEIIDEVSYPKYRVDYINDDPEKLRVGQTISLKGNGESLRKIIKLTTVSDYRDDILLDSAFIPDALGEDTLFIVTGVAYGNHSHIEGNGCFSLSNSSHAEGTGSVALGKYAHAEGLETLAEGSRSHAEGAWTKAIKDEAHAEGQYSEARARASHAEGYKSVTSKEGYSSNTLEPHAQGTGTSSWVNGISHAEGNATIAQGLGAHAEGEKTFANERATHAEGLNTVVKSEYSHAEGNGTIAGAGPDDGTAAHAEGEGTKATAWATHAEGYRTEANAWVSHSEGANTVAGTANSQPSAYNSDTEGRFAHAEGNGTWAKGSASHAEGRHTQALKKYDHAEGWGTTANGIAAHAEGEDTQANAECSHAEGWETRTSNDCEHAEGQFNKSNTGNSDGQKTVHSIGIGTNNSNRTNAFEVMKNGDTYLIGVGGYDGTNPSSATPINKLIGGTIITASPRDSLVVTLPKGDEGIKASYRIDMTAAVYGGDVDARYIGSLIIEVNDLAMQTAHGYYYGDDMDEILSEVAIWKDDPEFYPDEQRYFLLLTTDSNLNEVIFSISSLDGQSVDAVAANEDEKVKVADATITPVGSGGGDGKMGVISQTQTWTQAADEGWDYTITDKVYGIIPQAFIDLVTKCSYPGVVVFDEATGYFQMNGLTNISQAEMAQIYSEKAALTFAKAGDMYQFLNITAGVERTQSLRTLFPVLSSAALVINSDYMKYLSEVEVLAFAPINITPASYNFCYLSNVANIARAFYNNCKALRKIVTPLRCQGSTTFANTTFSGCPSLEDVYVQSLKSNIWFTQSSRLTLASVVYMVENAANTSVITITLHATAYARCQADATEYTYQGNTYTGIIAYANARNIKIEPA